MMFDDEVIKEEIVKPLAEKPEKVLSADLARGDSKSVFESFGKEVASLRERAEKIAVTDSSQKDLMKEARGIRLVIRNIRIAVDKKRLDMTADYKRRASEIDLAARILRLECERLETHLENNEKYAERQEALRIENLKIERSNILLAICPTVNTSVYNLGGMSDEEFRITCRGIQAEIEHNLAEEKARAEELKRKDDELRQQAEKDRQARVAAEAEAFKLRQEAAITQAKQAEEKRKMEAEQARSKAQREAEFHAKVAEATKRAEKEHEEAAKKLAEAQRQKTALEKMAPVMLAALRKIADISDIAPEDWMPPDYIRGHNDALKACREIANEALNQEV